MKKLPFSISLLVAVLIFSHQETQAQSVGVGTNTPDSSARLDVESINQGFLPPRLTTIQRNSVTSPAAGLMIYNTDTRCIEFWNGSKWETTCSPILFEKIMTPGWLLANATDMDPSAFYNTVEDYLQIGTGTLEWQRLMQIPLIGSGILNDTQTYIIEITISRSVYPTADNDVYHGISDGTTFIGFSAVDNTSPGAMREGNSGPTLTSNVIETSGAGDDYKLYTTITGLNGDSNSWGAFSGSDAYVDGHAAKSYFLNVVPSDGIFLELYRNNTSEEYAIDYIHVQIRKEVGSE